MATAAGTGATRRISAIHPFHDATTAATPKIAMTAWTAERAVSNNPKICSPVVESTRCIVSYVSADSKSWTSKAHSLLVTCMSVSYESRSVSLSPTYFIRLSST